MDGANTHQWEYDIPGSVLIWNAVRMFAITIALCWFGAEVFSWFHHSSATLALVAAAGRGEIGLYAGASFVALVVVGTLIVTAGMYRGGYAVRFRITAAGATAETMPKQRAANRKVRVTLVAAALASGNPQMLGVTYASQARESASIVWGRVRKVVPDRRRRRIALKDFWHTALELRCTPENYDRVCALIERHIADASARAGGRAQVR